MNYSQKELLHIKENTAILKEMADFFISRGVDIDLVAKEMTDVINNAIKLHMIEWKPIYFLAWFKKQAHSFSFIKDQ